jgi:hypothetical protein
MNQVYIRTFGLQTTLGCVKKVFPYGWNNSRL